MSDRRRVIRDAYDDIADAHDAERAAGPVPERPLVADLLDDVPADAHVLDAGCGSGAPIASMLADHVRVTGVDFSGAQLALAAANAPTADLVQGDVTAIPFVADAFDALVSIYTVIHVPWADQAGCFDEFHRVSRPDAPALLTVGTEDWEGSQSDWMGMGAEMHWTIPGPERTERLLTDAGFTVEERITLPDPVSEEDGEKLFVRARA